MPSAPIAPTDGEVHDVAAVSPAVLSHVRVLADIAAHHRERVIVEGTYEIEPLRPRAGHKGGNLTWIVLDDGTRVSRSYGAIRDEYGYVDRRVLATGTITSGPPNPNLQSLLAPHIIVETVALESGVGPSLTILPAPPIASTTPALGARMDRWVQIIGKPGAVGSFALDDGGVVRVEDCDASEWTPLLGRRATLNGQLAMEKGPGAYALDFVIRGRHALCAGVEPRCGM